jgi:hypothetical protein
MGAVCAVVYLFTLITFIPWPFYKDIVVATSGGGNRDVIKELEEVETGRLLHRFPHNKVPTPPYRSECPTNRALARVVSICSSLAAECGAAGHW